MTERSYNLKKQIKDERDLKAEVVQQMAIPSMVDLRPSCPLVFDQKNVGSCTGQAGVAARMMLTDISTMLSRLYLYYKERELEGTIGEDAGATMRDICKVLHKFGVAEESLMPYDVKKWAVAPSKEAEENAPKYKINAYKSLVGVNQIKQYIGLNQKPVLIGMAVYDSFESEEVARTGVVPMPDIKHENCLGGHAVLIVGYKDTTNSIKKKNLIARLFSKPVSDGYFIIRNSWGKEWGDKGYFYLPYEFVEKELAYDAWVIE